MKGEMGRSSSLSLSSGTSGKREGPRDRERGRWCRLGREDGSGSSLVVLKMEGGREEAEGK